LEGELCADFCVRELQVQHLVIATVLESLQFPDTDRALFQLQFERLARAKGSQPPKNFTVYLDINDISIVYLDINQKPCINGVDLIVET